MCCAPMKLSSTEKGEGVKKYSRYDSLLNLCSLSLGGGTGVLSAQISRADRNLSYGSQHALIHLINCIAGFIKYCDPISCPKPSSRLRSQQFVRTALRHSGRASRSPRFSRCRSAF